MAEYPAREVRVIDEPESIGAGEPVSTTDGSPAPGSEETAGAAVESTLAVEPAAARAGPSTESLPADVPADRERKPRRRPRDLTLLRAYRAARPVEGRIVQVIKGGYEVKLGRARGFCPHSQMDLHREEHPERHVGQVYQFRVTQLRRGGEDAVVSRRAVLEEERAEEAKAVRATLIEGAVMQGHVAGIADFGAFVDLGAGVMGLVHVSELAHARVRRVDAVVQFGDTVQVKILKLDDRRGRISLSMRQVQGDPWSGIEERFREGQTYPGTVLRVAEFGAFVGLAPGVEALAPASELPPFPAGWKESLVPGTMRDWFVLAVDPTNRRISLTLPAEGDVPAILEPGAVVEGKVQRVEKYGVFVWLGPGRVGLMPREWSGALAGDELGRRFPVGGAIEVTVAELSDEGRRLRLSRKGISLPADGDPVRERADSSQKPRPPRPQRAPARPAEPPPPTFGNSLAEKLKDALGRRQS